MDSVEANENLLHKWDVILVEIFKKEWPNSWTSFVTDLVSAATESESRCRNSMYILKTVVEDVFQFSESTLTSKFSKEIQTALLNDMIQIFTVYPSFPLSLSFSFASCASKCCSIQR